MAGVGAGQATRRAGSWQHHPSSLDLAAAVRPPLVSSSPTGCPQRGASIPQRFAGMPWGGYIWDEGAWLSGSDSCSCTGLSAAGTIPSCLLLLSEPTLCKSTLQSCALATAHHKPKLCSKHICKSSALLMHSWVSGLAA